MSSRAKFIIICLSNFISGLSYIGLLAVPLVCWLIWRRDNDPDVANYARCRLNTALSWCLYGLLAWLIFNYFSMLIGMALWAVIGLGWIYYFALDIMRAAQGDPSYEFPLTFDFLSRPAEK